MLTATFHWLIGSPHAAVHTTPQSASGTRDTFVSWVDSASATRTIVVPSSPTTYVLHYATQYLLTTTSSSGGGIAPQPASVDGYYTAGTTVQLSPLPSSGFSLGGWQCD